MSVDSNTAEAVLAPDDLTDIHLLDGQLHNSLLFGKGWGPRRPDDSEMASLQALCERCRACSKADFMITAEGLFFRGHREDRSVDGVWYTLRRMPSQPPQLDRLPTALSPAVMRLLLSPKLGSGGLIYVVGSPGSGKTTTASATLVSRLQTFGGFAYTVEDPPEMPLNGWHGAGYCRQTWVAGDENSDWFESMRGVLRSQPASSRTVLLISEIRNEQSARMALRAASNGFLVITTGFATDIPSGLSDLVRLLGADGSVGLAAVLRLALLQRLQNGVISTQFLVSPDGASSVAIKLRSSQMQHLASDIQFQANRAMLGEHLL